MNQATSGNECAKDALLNLCEGASRRSEIDTPDSWMMRAEGAQLRSKAIEALHADPVIGTNVGNNRFLHVAGVSAGSGLEILDPWLRCLLQRTVIALGSDRSSWEGEVDRFLDVLSVRDGRVRCTVRSAFAGITLADGGFELEDAVVRPAAGADFHVPIGGATPTGIVFEYGTDLPASAGPLGFSFPDHFIADVDTSHQTRLTRFLLAVALNTSAPIQEQLVMKEVDFGSGGSGRLPEETGPIVALPSFSLDYAAVERVRECYVALGGRNLARLGVATRRFLLARTERVRPTDQIIDYAIALESMTSQHYGDKQGKELAKLLAHGTAERQSIESEHRQFRAAREAIVHEGVVPADAPLLAGLGRDLVRRSLLSRTRLSPRAPARQSAS